MSDSPVTTPLVIMAPRTDGFEALWGVDRLCRGWLEWRTEDGSGLSRSDAFGMVPQSDAVIRVRVDGRLPGSSVRVRAVTAPVDEPGVEHVSAWRTVRLPDPRAASAHLAVWNDTHQHPETLAALDACTPAVDLLVWNGDLGNNWESGLDEIVRTVLAPAGLDISADRALAVAVGNHDVRGRWAHRLRDVVASPDGRPYCAGRIGPVAYVLLHTGEDKPDAHPTFEGRVALEDLRAAQTAWLAEALQDPEIRDAPYRVVFCHIPLRWTDESAVDYDAEGYDWFSAAGRDAWDQSLRHWGAQVIVSGHTHGRAWIPSDARFPYAQLISGGPDPDPAAEEAASWVEITADEHSLRLTMRTLDGAVVVEEDIRPAPVADRGR